MEPQSSLPIRDLDAHALKGLAHPLRMEIYDVLSKHGPQTCTTLAQRLGASTGLTSYHLRQLARHNFIHQIELPAEDSRCNAKEKWWERTPGAVNVTPQSGPDNAATKASAGFIIREFARRNSRALEDFAEAIYDENRLPVEWAEASETNTTNLRLTASQLREINDHFFNEFLTFVEKYRGRNDPGSRPVHIQFNAFPLIDGEETPS